MRHQNTPLFKDLKMKIRAKIIHDTWRNLTSHFRLFRPGLFCGLISEVSQRGKVLI